MNSLRSCTTYTSNNTRSHFYIGRSASHKKCLSTSLAAKVLESRVNVYPARNIWKGNCVLNSDRTHSLKNISGGVRSYSTLSHPSIEKGKVAYIHLNEAPNELKTEIVLNHVIKHNLSVFGVSKISSSIPQQWDLLSDYLENYHNYTIPEFNQNHLIENLQILLRLYSQPLIKGRKLLAEPKLPDYVFNPTDVYWSQADVGIPFMRKHEKTITDVSTIQGILKQCPNSEAISESFKKNTIANQKVLHYSLLNDTKDATAATLLAVPHLNEESLLYEMGCWNGQNLLNLLFYASLKEKSPKYCIGTDINLKAVRMAQCISKFFFMDEPFIRFYLSNIRFPVETASLGLKFGKEVRLALRLIPILNPSDGRDFLVKMRNSLNHQDVFILSYAITKGDTYHKNLIRAEDRTQNPRVTKEEFSGGVAFWQELTPEEVMPSFLAIGQASRYVMNTYYTEEGFSRLAQECGFKIQNSIFVHDEDNNRCTVELHCM